MANINEQQQIDRMFMKHAYQLATKGKVSCYPNPAVGCVIVKNHHVIGEGYHHYAGHAHAELNTINKIKQEHPNEWQQLLKDATVYVTLEPCSHHGRTPPCANLLIDCQIKRVVIGQVDFTSKVNGKGISMLREAGIEVSYFPYKPISLLNTDFFYLNASNFNDSTVLPYIRIKVGASLDGRTCLPNGESKWITNEKSRTYVQALRLHSDAILCTARTIIRDQARYTIRYDQLPLSLQELYDPKDIKQPLVIINDNSQKLTGQELIFKTGPMYRFIIISHQSHKLEPLAQDLSSPLYGIRFITGFNTHDVYSLTSLLLHLKNKFKIKDLMIEAGSTFVSQFLTNNLFNELHYCISPIILGSGNVGLNTINEYQTVSQAMRLTFAYSYQLDDNNYFVFVSNRNQLPKITKLSDYTCDFRLEDVTEDLAVIDLD